jgi:hypothetical protein
MSLSAKWSTGCGFVAGTITAPFSLTLGLIARSFGHARSGDSEWLVIPSAYLLPAMLSIGLVVLLAKGRGRLTALAAGLAGITVGYLILWSTSPGPFPLPWD